MQYYNIEAELWALVHWMEPWIWYARAVAAFAAFVFLFFQPWKVSRTALFFRYLSMVGACLVGCSLFNRPMGPLGDLIFWPSYAIYQSVMVWKMLPALRAQMRQQPSFPEATVLRYAFTRQLPGAENRRRAA